MERPEWLDEEPAPEPWHEAAYFASDDSADAEPDFGPAGWPEEQAGPEWRMWRDLWDEESEGG